MRGKMIATEPTHDVFQAIADPNRRKMLVLLAETELPIAEIVKQFPISRTAVNKHLHVLADAGLVMRRKQGRETRYQMRPAPLAEVKQWIAFFDQYWDEKLDALAKFVGNNSD
ncbi:DNA-binding transcriptional ArsR family regulator [Alicyclobacillus cycloheptanicus]|uniref:DNA-binding transcriptional ArsR family regulator n=2 Tax=Alicyclobacillus cycloheptanicus TaxID=1457 RepID=A0ABT9XHN3_9BACL|nr:DNA-binding transcriptional ArsR family regulator [Alicyclobacillus cycloheptanicus]